MTVGRVVLGAALAVLVAATWLAAGALGSRKPVIPARVQVASDEYSFRLSRQWVKAGPAIIELVNYGEDPHDLTMRRQAKGAKTYRVKETLPEHEAILRATLVPGRYLLWCSIADHRDRGMEAMLTVKKR